MNPGDIQKFNIYKHIANLVLILLLITSCTNKVDKRLLEVENLTSSSPNKAISILKSINRDSLSNSNREYYEFLEIKCADKAFIKHTSDSLILKVIKQENRNKKRGKYPEALYYGGRVYHDLGDFPSALNYYQNAIDYIDNDNKYMKLKGSILAQITDLLLSLRLYDQAIPYIKQSISIDSILNDSVNLVYDIEQLGKIYMQLNHFNLAEFNLKESLKLAKTINIEDTTEIKMYMARTKYYKGSNDSALSIIRTVIPCIDSVARNTALSYACYIYERAEIKDTAILYARELIRSNALLNKETGYQIIMSEALTNPVSFDSLIHCAINYRKLIEAKLNRNGDTSALIQNSFYNYQLHQRKVEVTQKKNRILKKWILGIAFIIFMMIIVILYYKNRNKANLLNLRKALDTISFLRMELDKSKEEDINKSDLEHDLLPIMSSYSDKKQIENLRIKLKNELISLENNSIKKHIIPQLIMDSEIYNQITEYIKHNKNIPDNSELWHKIEDAVLSISPNFKYKINLLLGSNISESDYHMSLLIKLGISPSNLAILLSKAKSTISYRRNNISFQIFGKKLDMGTIDNIIRSL